MLRRSVRASFSLLLTRNVNPKMLSRALHSTAVTAKPQTPESSLVLNTGSKIPALGLGTWESPPGQVGKAVETALRSGYRHIDCAYIYENEPEIGEALNKCFKEGVVRREEVFITSKLWHTFHAKKDVLPACEMALASLQLEYLDLYLIHGPVSFKEGAVGTEDKDNLGYDPNRIARTWEGTEELVEKGLVRAIGISNFTITKTERLLQTAKIVPAANQVECHPHCQQQKLAEYCKSKGIQLMAYSPLGSPARPPDMNNPSDPVVMEDPVLKDVATKHSASIAQVCIAFALHRGLVVIPKTVNPARITENLKSTELKLDAEDMRRLRGIDRNRMLFCELPEFVPRGLSWEQAWDIEADQKFVI